jgi:hypothetical protein
MGPTASSVSPACCLDQDDTPRLSYNQSLVFGEFYHDKVQERSRLTWAMHLTLVTFLLWMEGLVVA